MKKWLTNKKIGTRILLGFLVVAVITAAVGGIGIFSLQSVHQSYSLAYTDSVTALSYVEELSSTFQAMRIQVFGVVLAQSAQDKEEYVARIAEYGQTMRDAVAGYRDMLSRYEVSAVQNEHDLINAIEAELLGYAELRDALVSGIAMQADRQAEAYESLRTGGAIGTQAQQVDAVIRELIDYNNRYAHEQIAANGRAALFSTLLMIGCVAVSVALAMIVGASISRSISRPVKNLVKAANALALGDVEVSVHADTNDEIGELVRSFGLMAANIRAQAHLAERIAGGDLTVEVDVRSEADLLGRKLSEMVEGNNVIFSGIAAAADQVNDGALQLSDASQSLAQGSGEQASSIEEISASIEEVAEQTKQNAGAASQANEVVSSAMDQAKQGNGRMSEMMRAMAAINESSTNISKIIKAIDDIAFQTNILALNAAVEAARAGSAGRGFAVVADEVRTLAGKAAAAAKETTALIEDSIQKVQAGTTLAHDTAAILREIVDNTARSAELVSGIATASNDQTAGIEQISIAVNQVAQVVQTNSATAEETASVSEELAAQAEELKAIVAQVRLKASSISAAIGSGDMLPQQSRSALGAGTQLRASSGLGKY